MFEIDGTTDICRDVVIQRSSTPVTRDRIMELEAAIRSLPEQIDLDSYTRHHFAPGVYVRELFIPAGTVLTGKIHKHETMNILVSGTIRVTVDDRVIELKGPLVYNSEPGMKKAAYAVTDTIWMNIHPTDETDVERIEEEFIAPSFEALEHTTMNIEEIEL